MEEEEEENDYDDDDVDLKRRLVKKYWSKE
jgi:hypothetical protein